MSASEKTAGNAADVKPTTAAELSAAFPDLVASIRTEAATLERDRIIGIDKLAMNRKGIDKLVGDLKADATCTVEKAALRIMEHEGQQLAAQADNIRRVEEVAEDIKPAPSAMGAENPPRSEANTPEGWKAEYAGSQALQQEFGSADVYVSFKQGEAEGRVRRLVQKSA